MPPKPSSKSKVSSQKSRTSTLLRSDSPPPTKKLKTLTLAKPPVFRLDSQPPNIQPLSQTKPSLPKGKGKVRSSAVEDDQLWVDKYEPHTEEELAVHVRKVEDVRRWFTEAFEGGPTGKLKKYRRILTLTGPAGTAKTTTVRILARELGFEIIEWKNSIGERYDVYGGEDVESLMEKFQAFLFRASTSRSIFGAASSTPQTRQVILLEDLPNILHSETQKQFHESLQLFVQRSTEGHIDAAPVVIVISDAGVRGESGEEGNWGQQVWKTKEALDVRSVLPPDLLNSPYATQVRFNPIAPTLMKKALQTLLDTRFQGSTSSKPSKEMLDVVIESSNGDIRSAIMALQFACVVDIPTDKKGKKKSSKGSARAVLESVTRREQSLHLFHLIGKILYNKRKGDHPSASMSKKDAEKERIADEAINDPPKLPTHLSGHERRPSRVNVDILYADSPIDSSLFSLYIQQNYTQFCNEVDECEGISDWLSWIDCSGPEEWFQANPHRFHLLTLGTLHSLPTPVPRRSQKMFKPDFFERLKNEKEALDGVRDVQDWLTKGTISVAGGWSKTDVALELGAVLRARENSIKHPPLSHRNFSTLKFDGSGFRSSQLDENDNEEDASATNFDGEIFGTQRELGKAEQGGWLDGDDIEDF